MIEQLRDFYDEIWAADFEYSTGATEADPPKPICVVGVELFSGRTVRTWLDGGAGVPPPCPFNITDRTLYLAYYASAEISCHLALEWPIPNRILDLYAEYRGIVNSDPVLAKLPRDKDIGKFSLSACLHTHGLHQFAIDPEHKTRMRNLCIRGGPYTHNEMEDLLKYCESDVIALQHLFPKMLSKINLGHALLRGRYMASVGAIERRGVPVNLELAKKLQSNWDDVISCLIERKRPEFDIIKNKDIDQPKFRDWLTQHDLLNAWPRTITGFCTDKDTLKKLSKIYPIVGELKEFLGTIRKSRLFDTLLFGSDGYNRTLLSTFASITGRNQPSTSKGVFGPSCWVRHLIKPPPGFALLYCDWSGQEYGIAAYLSTDEQMIADYESGDPYLAFAKRFNRAPAYATKASHPQLREQMKVALGLGVLYGARPATISKAGQMSLLEAASALRAHEQTYRKFWRWREQVIDTARLRGHLQTCYGWRWAVTGADTTSSISNWLMQAHGAEMMRLACCLAVENRVQVCLTVHDALLVMCPVDEIEQTRALTVKCMEDASSHVLNGPKLRVGVEEPVVYPNSYCDKRGEQMFAGILSILQEIEGAE